jgi:hypothetical protein
MRPPCVYNLLVLVVRRRAFLASTAMCAAIVAGIWAAAGAASPEKPSNVPALTLQGEAAWTELERRGEKVPLLAALDRARYDAQPVDGRSNTVVVANPAHSLRATFSPEGVRLSTVEDLVGSSHQVQASPNENWVDRRAATFADVTVSDHHAQTPVQIGPPVERVAAADHVMAMVYDGPNDLQAIARRVYRNLSDTYDFLTLHVDRSFNGGTAAYLAAQNKVEGLGRPLFDNSLVFGSVAGRLQGVSIVHNDSVDLHERLHQFANFLPEELGLSSNPASSANECLNPNHWAALVSFPGFMNMGSGGHFFRHIGGDRFVKERHDGVFSGERGWVESNRGLVPNGYSIREPFNVTQLLQTRSTTLAVAYSSRNLGAFFSEDGGRSWKPPVVEGGRLVAGLVSRGEHSDQVFGQGFPAYNTPPDVIVRSDDGGKVWKVDSYLPQGESVCGSSQCQISGIQVSVSDPSVRLVLLWNLASAFRSIDSGRTWTAVGTNVRTDFLPHAGRLYSFTSAGGKQTLYVAGQKGHGQYSFGGGLSRSTDGGQTWQLLPGYAPYETYKMAASPRSGKLWASTSDGLLTSDDEGTTWKKIAFDFSGYIRDLAFTDGPEEWLYLGVAPMKPPYAYASRFAAEGGNLWRTRDRGRTFEVVDIGLRSPAVLSILVGAGRSIPAFVGAVETMRYSPLEQYLMGLRAAADVPPVLTLRAASSNLYDLAAGEEFTGQGAKVVTIADIQASVGERSKRFPDASRPWRVAHVFLSDDDLPDAVELQALEDKVREQDRRFVNASENRVAVDSRIALRSTGAPEVRQFTPTFLPAKHGGRLEILGAGFQQGVKVKVGSQVIVPDAVNDGRIELTVPGPQEVGAVWIGVHNPNGETSLAPEQLLFTATLDVSFYAALPYLAKYPSGVDCIPQKVDSRVLAANRVGTIADGTSALVVRVETTVPVKIELANPSGVDGTLSSCGTGTLSNSQPTGGFAYALYTPPDQFGSTTTATSRSVTLNVTPVAGSTTPVAATVALHRVPVVLVHGILSSDKAWKEDGWIPKLRGLGYRATTINYGSSDLTSFSDVESKSVRTVRSAIGNVLKDLNASGVAASRVDAIGHSMGGLLIRQLGMHPDYLKDTSSAYRGVVRRLVTIGTPHLGSPWATLIAPLVEVATAGLARFLVNLVLPDLNISAVRDLMSGSAATQSILNSPVPTHSIVGVTSPDPPPTMIEGIAGPLAIVSKGVMKTFADLFVGNEQHDIIVGATSQAGGRVAGSTATMVTPVVHSSKLPGVTDVDELSSPAVFTAAVGVLAAPDGAFVRDLASRERPTLSTGGDVRTPTLSADTQAVITSPQANATVPAGTSVSVSVSGAGPVNVLWVSLEGGGFESMPATLPSTITLAIPNDFPVGRRTLAILGSDSSGSLFGDAIDIVVVPSTSPTAISASPESLTLKVGDIYQLSARATFGDASQADITSLATYASSNVSVATVDVDGQVSARRSGTATLSVTYGTTTDSVSVSVSPSLQVSPTALSFTGVGTTAGWLALTPAQTLVLDQPGAAPFGWSVSSSVPWITVSPSSGTGPAQITVTMSGTPESMTASTSAVLTIDAAAAANAPLSVPISFVRKDASLTSPPVGQVDTPSQNATGVVGAIAVTGWALDDIGVERVEIWRNCLTPIDSSRAGVCRTATPMGAADRVFIGTAAFVPGARTDIETNPIYAGYPQAYRAGWGYLLLTNALPNQSTGATEGGQGPVTLYAYAIDREGSYTELGSKTVTLDNDNATVPFGAIDAPEQGSTVTATLSANFGWAMTRRRNAAGADIPKCIARTRYRVFINGVARTLTTGVNWHPNLVRSDLAAAYPGLCDSANSLAAYYIDVAALGLANATHTIGWDVYDDNGTPGNTADDNVAGIGSRFFNILVGAADVATDALSSRPASRGAATDVAVLPTMRNQVVRARVGAIEAPAVAVLPDGDGARQINLPAGSRVAVDLGGPVSRGYLVVGHELRDLPIGSTLDAATGHFYWQPAVPFFGSFELVFVSDAQGTAARTTVVVTVTDPTASGDPAITITSPKAGANPNPVIAVTGTARDPQAVSGTGIDTVHVWAYRSDVDGVPPQYLGEASLKGEAYALTTAPLSPGTYDVAVFAWVARTGTWAPTAVVTIAVR